MTDTLERYTSLADRLYELTLDKKLGWEENPFDKGVECELGDYFIELRDTEDGSGNPYISVRIKNKSGSIIDSFTDETIRNYTPPSMEKSTYWLLLSDLMFQAHRQISGADNALDAILKHLDKM